MDLEILGPLGLCLRCGVTRPALTTGAPTCCDDFAVLTVWVVTQQAPAQAMSEVPA